MKRLAPSLAEIPSVSVAQVEGFLRAHPDFFSDQPDLLEVMTVPHACGEAVSLVAGQLEVLRNKNKRLGQQLDELVQIARENDAIYQRVHQLSLALLDANSVADLLGSLNWGLCQFFQADFAAVRLLGNGTQHSLADLMVPSASPETEWCEMVIESEKAQCGRPLREHSVFLFGETEADAVQSYAVIGLRHAGLRGVFGIGSRDVERFHSDMGVVFLRHLSEVLVSRLAALLAG